MTLAHWELAPVLALLDAGLPMTAPIAAALGRTDRLPALLQGASGTGQINAILPVTPQDGAAIPAPQASVASGYRAFPRL